MGEASEWNLVTAPIALKLRSVGWAVDVEHRFWNGTACDILAQRGDRRIVIEAKVQASISAIPQVLGYAQELGQEASVIASWRQPTRVFQRQCEQSEIALWDATVPPELLRRRILPPLPTETMRDLDAWIWASCDDASVKEAAYSFPELTIWQVREAFSWLAAWGHGEWWGWGDYTPRSWKRERFIPSNRPYSKSMSLTEMHARLDHRPLRDTVTHHDFSRRKVA